MPCTYDGPNIHYIDNPELKKELDKLTRMLCETLTKIESLNNFADLKIILTEETYEWWENHKKMDEKRRIEDEKIKQRKILDIECEIELLKNKLKTLKG